MRALNQAKRQASPPGVLLSSRVIDDPRLLHLETDCPVPCSSARRRPAFELCLTSRDMSGDDGMIDTKGEQTTEA
jgi:hypothetical protein